MGATVLANCNKCGGGRNAYVRATHTVAGSDGEVLWEETVMEILECRGYTGMNGDYSEEAQDGVAEYFNVSPMTICTHLVNRGRIKVEDAPGIAGRGAD